MDRFSKYNPKVTLLFYFLVIVVSLSVFNPVYLSISLVSALIYKFMLEGKKAFLSLIKLVFGMVILVGIFNMLFSHRGMTVLFSLSDTNFTLESLVYGLTQGLMFGSVIAWFSCYNSVVSSQMLLAVFGGFLPNTALVFSMVLSFIPRMKKNIREIEQSRILLDNDKGKLKKAISNFSALVTMTLEETIELSDSMRGRGFCNKRTVYSKYRLNLNDVALMLIEVMLALAVVLFKHFGKISAFSIAKMSVGVLSPYALVSYTFFTMLPVIINLKEELKWRYLKQKI